MGELLESLYEFFLIILYAILLGPLYLLMLLLMQICEHSGRGCKIVMKILEWVSRIFRSMRDKVLDLESKAKRWRDGYS